MVLVQIDILQKTTRIYEDDKRSLQNELETREQRLQRELSDKRRMEQRMHGAVTDTQLKWEKECVSQSSARRFELRAFAPQPCCLWHYRTDALTSCRWKCKTSFW